jgi:hypothetical protein
MMDDKRIRIVHTLEASQIVTGNAYRRRWRLPANSCPGSATALKTTEGYCRASDKLVKAAFRRQQFRVPLLRIGV